MIERERIQSKQSRKASQAPVIAAVRVPPSAWITSQSMTIWRSPSACRLVTARKLRPMRRWISCVRPVGLPDGGFAPRARMGGARQHGIFRRHPAAALAAQPRRRLVFERRRAKHMGIAEFHEAGALGIAGDAALETDGAHFVGRAFAGTHESSCLGGGLLRGFPAGSARCAPLSSCAPPLIVGALGNGADARNPAPTNKGADHGRDAATSQWRQSEGAPG